MSAQPSPQLEITLDDVTVAYDGHAAVVGASFHATPGVTAVIGPNGSGKTSVLTAISGMVRPTSGTVVIAGEPARAGRPDLAHVLQTTTLNDALPLTVEEVVRMGRYPHLGAFGRFTSADRDAVQDAMARLDITDLARRQVRDLSGGQQQRAFIAQGLAQGAPILLLDEPVNGLDLPSQERIQHVIREEADKGHCVILTTHDLGTAAKADHVVLMATHVVASGPPSEVLTSEHLGHAYGGTTFRTIDGVIVLADSHVHETKVSGHHDH